MIKPGEPKESHVGYYSVVDIETSPDGSVLDIGYGIMENGEQVFYQVYPNWDAWIAGLLEQISKRPIKQRRHLRTIHAHNGANFDWPCLVQYLQQHSELGKCYVIMSGSTAIGIVLEIAKLTIRLYDSMRLLPASLDKLCKEFKVEHQKIEIDDIYKSRMNEYKAKFTASYYSYLHNDVIGLLECLYKFHCMLELKQPGFGPLHMTLPGIALRSWTLTLTEFIMIPWNPGLKAFERESYSGGYTNCHFIGIYDNVICLDINSMYPYHMLSKVYPASYKGVWTKQYQGKHGLYEIDFEQPTDYPPMLLDKKQGKHVYTGHGVFTQPEIEALISIGGTIVCYQGFVFAEMKPIFKEFVTLWWETRQQAIKIGDTALSFICKILMNSLYGKLAQREERVTLKVMSYGERIERLEKGIHDIFYPDTDFVAVTEPAFSETTFVSVASYVTAYSRVHIHELNREVIKRGGIVLYNDTDSVHFANVSKETISDLVDETTLGMCKVEWIDTAVYLGKKLYATKHGLVKAKGIGRILPASQESLTYTMLVRIYKNGPEQIDYLTFPSVREIILENRVAARLIPRHRTLQVTGSHHA